MSTRRQERARRRFRPRLLGGGVLGQGQGGGVGQPVAAPSAWLIYDDFTSDLSAGAVDGTAAEPGPGGRNVTDTNSKLSLSSGALSIATGGVGVRDPGVWYRRMDRLVGRTLLGEANQPASGLEFGWGQSSGGTGITIRLQGTSLRIRQAGVVLAIGDMATSTTYQLAVILRAAAGALFFIRGGSFTTWTLIWVSDASTTQDNYATAHATTTSSVVTVNYLKVPMERWMPAPVLSDGFGSTFGTSDGLGHAEGVIGGLGAGGDGVSWTEALGTWATSAGRAAATSGGAAFATAPAGEVDLIITARCYLSSGTMGIIVRWVDVNNYVLLRITPTNRQLVKVLSGTPSTVTDVGYTYVAGAPLRLVVAGTKFRAYYNDALVGSEYTISDVALQSGTVVGLQTDNTGNQFDSIVVWARGTDGEHAQLEMIRNWYGAAGTITYANLLEQVTDPTPGTAYAGAGVTDGQPWTVAVRATWNGSATQFAFDSQSGRLVLGAADTGSNKGVYVDAAWFLPSLIVAADAVYFLVCDGATISAYRNNVFVGVVNDHVAIGGTTVWAAYYAAGTHDWAGDFPGGVVYDVALDATQRAALYAEMARL